MVVWLTIWTDSTAPQVGSGCAGARRRAERAARRQAQAEAEMNFSMEMNLPSNLYKIFKSSHYLYLFVRHNNLIFLKSVINYWFFFLLLLIFWHCVFVFCVDLVCWNSPFRKTRWPAPKRIEKRAKGRTMGLPWPWWFGPPGPTSPS